MLLVRLFTFLAILPFVFGFLLVTCSQYILPFPMALIVSNIVWIFTGWLFGKYFHKYEKYILGEDN